MLGRELWSAIRADYSAKLPESTDLTLLYKVTLFAKCHSAVQGDPVYQMS